MNDILFNTGTILKRRGVWMAVKGGLQQIRNRGTPVLIYGCGYNWDDALPELIAAGYRIHRLHGEPVRSPRDSYRVASARIRKRKIAYLLLSTHGDAGGHAVVQAAHDHGIPVVSWQHGGAGYCYHPMMPYLEFLNSDIHLVFGKGVAEGYAKTCELMGISPPAFIPVGSSTLDRIGTLPVQEADFILYVTANSISMGWDPITWAGHLESVQRAVVDLAAGYPEQQFVIKLHPTQKDLAPFQRYIQGTGARNIRLIVDEMSVPELARRASATIIDQVSTAILEVALFQKPLFVYTGLGGVDPQVQEILARRARVSSNISDFVRSVARFIEGDRTNRQDDEFMKLYGIHNGDGKSAERAVMVLRGIIGAPSQEKEGR